ncbi:MAG: PTS sugar transporter subunit IIA [Acidiferrobacteraceae bacterium]|nr:PTS sugar transporter subunit IIA [Acidiferrobacteraceae bacterium]|tara:strand:- start:3421 stop:3912 length:492 start_codon:yes stop_codon:yes gene_type:complete
MTADKKMGSDPHNSAGTVLKNLLTPATLRYGVSISSKKRLLEELALLFTQQDKDLDKDTVCRTLTERERLGSTSIGGGIALPHGRLNGIDRCLSSAIRLKQPLAFNSSDEEPITLAIALLVPADASKEHLNTLGALARLFNDAEHRQKILAATDANSLLALLV